MTYLKFIFLLYYASRALFPCDRLQLHGQQGSFHGSIFLSVFLDHGSVLTRAVLHLSGNFTALCLLYPRQWLTMLVFNNERINCISNIQCLLKPSVHNAIVTTRSFATLFFKFHQFANLSFADLRIVRDVKVVPEFSLNLAQNIIGPIDADLLQSSRLYLFSVFLFIKAARQSASN